MLNSIQYRRLLWLSLLVVLAYCGLGWRLVDLQYLRAGHVRRDFERRTAREYIEVPMRGEILDRHGAMLTKSVRFYDIGVEPPRVSPYQSQVAAVLAGPLEMDRRQLEALLTPVTNVTADGQVDIKPSYLPLKKGLSLERWKTISEIMRTNSFGLDPKRMTSRLGRAGGGRRAVPRHHVAHPGDRRAGDAGGAGPHRHCRRSTHWHRPARDGDGGSLGRVHRFS